MFWRTGKRRQMEEAEKARARDALFQRLAEVLEPPSAAAALAVTPCEGVSAGSPVTSLRLSNGEPCPSAQLPSRLSTLTRTAIG